MAKLTIASVRKAMPGVEVFHLTDADTPMVEGADGVKRVDVKLPMAVRRMMHNAQLDGDWLLIDCDIIIKKDVRHVFDESFDVALTDRIGTDMEGTSYGKAMPFNMGVAFSRSPAFWQRVIRHMSSLPMDLQSWTGDQLVVCAMVRQGLADDFKVKILPGLTYNYPPLSVDDPRMENAAIVHFKGARKKFIKEAA